MPTRAAVIEAAYQFLKAISERLEARLGKRPKRKQRSIWMAHTESGGISSQEYTRRIFNRATASNAYQTIFAQGKISQQQQQLEEIMLKADISGGEMQHGYLVPLVYHWLSLPDPLMLKCEGLSQMLDEFADAVVDKVILTKSRSIIFHLDLQCEPLVLQRGVSIRSITNEEMWELGEVVGPWDSRNALSFLPIPSIRAPIPSEDWKILDINLRHAKERVYPPKAIDDIRGAVPVALSLASPGHLQLFALGTTAYYSMAALGTLQPGNLTTHIGIRGGQYTLNASLSESLKDLWPHIYKIIKSKQHYLRMPALRLLDGGSRLREDDGIVDYAIGLEALLLKGIKDELSYRFALRGATILFWDGGEREKIFNELRDFYEVRSKIVHGIHVDPADLRTIRSTGERALREIWWWFFNCGESLSNALDRVDRRILRHKAG